MPNTRALPKQAASFIETMDCLPVSKLPEGPDWTYEIKLDGYRLEAVRSVSRTTSILAGRMFSTGRSLHRDSVEGSSGRYGGRRGAGCAWPRWSTGFQSLAELPLRRIADHLLLLLRL